MRKIRLGILGGSEEFREGFVGTAAATLIAGGLAAGGAVTGAAIGADAAGDATDASVRAQRDAMAMQERLAREGMTFQKGEADRGERLLREFYAQSQAQLKPFQDAQLGALGQAVGLTDPNNPIYQQQRGQMTEQIQRQLAAQGLLRSKNQVDLLSNLELGLGQQRSNQINSLLGLGAVQQGAANTQNLGGGLAQIAQNLGSNVGSSFGALGSANANSLASIGQTFAQGRLAQGNALSQGIQGFGNAIQGTIGNFQGLQQREQDMLFLKSLIGGAGAPGDALNKNQWFNR